MVVRVKCESERNSIVIRAQQIDRQSALQTSQKENCMLTLPVNA